MTLVPRYLTSRLHCRKIVVFNRQLVKNPQNISRSCILPTDLLNLSVVTRLFFTLQALDKLSEAKRATAMQDERIESLRCVRPPRFPLPVKYGRVDVEDGLCIGNERK